MILPPMIVDVRVHEEGSRDFRVWLPVFLLWPLLLLLVILLFVVTVPIDLLLWLFGARYHHFTALVIGALRLLAESRGVKADVASKDSIVRVVIT